MKKLIYMGMCLLLCLSAALFAGCDKDKENLNETSQEIPEIAMVYVEGGTFLMGATSEQGELYIRDAEKPVHEVLLDGFYIGKYEVTQEQWEAVMGKTLADERDKVAEFWGEDSASFGLYGVGNSYPMYYVSWEDAQSFCEKLSQKTGKKYRLPTEAEWEYAARGGQYTDGTKYAGSNNIDDVAWYGSTDDRGIGNGNNVAHPVGQKKPNGLGLYDMSGNVFEWCSDWYGENYYSNSPSVNPRGASNGEYRVSRGGCWIIGDVGKANHCRVSNRFYDDAQAFSGFRVVCEQ